ncbi:MAG: LTA synthase family protein [Oscillospiraceae bacterium]|nr:LTA synthase family protein [Oscillospiraceae bacterium]
MRGRIKQKPWLNRLVTWAAVVLYPYFCYLLMELCYPRAPFSWFVNYVVTRTPCYLYAWIFFSLLIAAATVLLRRVWIPCSLVGAVFFLATYADYYKRLYWNYPVVPSDLYTIGDAVDAVGFTSMPLTKRMIFFLALILLSSVLLSFFKLPENKAGKPWMHICAAAVLLFFCGAYYDAVFLKDNDLSIDAYYSNIISRYYEDTFFSAFFRLTNGQIFNKAVPDNYETVISGIGDEIGRMEAPKGQKSPDIIVILLETYYDMDQYGYEFDTDIHANYDRYKAQGYSGNILSCLYGGGTVNAEFEVFTGLATNNPYVTTIAYNDYIYDGIPNIVSYLGGKGYQSLVAVSYTSEMFNAVTAYSDLGFDKQQYIGDYDVSPIQYVRNQPSDESSVKQLIRDYERMAESDKPIFINLETMQNHGSYTNLAMLSEQGYETVKVTDPDAASLPADTVAQMEGVATLEKMTDDAIGTLLDYFSQSDRDVIVVLYGDHQSAISDDFNSVTGFDSGKSELEYYEDTHTTPYLVWCNTQPVEGQSFGTLSFNMLLPHALNAYNAVRPVYFDWLLRESQQGKYAFVSSDYAYTTQGTLQYADIHDPELNRYYAVQYDITHHKLLIGPAYRK